MDPSPKTLEELFCAAHGCAGEKFRSRVFWMCLHRHAVPVAPVVLALNKDFFAPDRELISAVALATSMAEIGEDIREFFLDPRNRHWPRVRANIRISCLRVMRLSSRYLPPIPKRPITAN
jgi:hypothetical protein